MTIKEAERIIEKMTDSEYDVFLKSLPLRTQYLIRSGIVNYRDVLPKWYIKLTTNKIYKIL